MSSLIVSEIPIAS